MALTCPECFTTKDQPHAPRCDYRPRPWHRVDRDTYQATDEQSRRLRVDRAAFRAGWTARVNDVVIGTRRTLHAAKALAEHAAIGRWSIWGTP